MDVFVVEMLVTMVTSLRLTHTDNKLQGTNVHVACGRDSCVTFELLPSRLLYNAQRSLRGHEYFGQPRIV